MTVGDAVGTLRDVNIEWLLGTALALGRVIASLISLALAQLFPTAANDAMAAAPASIPEIVANDNRLAAGVLASGALTLRLRAGEGVWRPRGEAGPALTIEAFGEASSPLSIPAPLVRVPIGTVIDAHVSNQLAHPLQVHGLCGRRGPCQPAVVPNGESRQIRFTADVSGTFHYWATTTGMPQRFRAAADSQLSGAFIVDDRADPPPDRVLVITEWTSLTTRDLHAIAGQDDPGAAFIERRPDVLFLINGRAWPHTERLRYDLHDRVRWRVVNLSTQVHPMHLHGFYFDVESLGTSVSDKPFPLDARPHVVTQVLQPGATMVMAWTAERAGNWLFHCHVMTHISPTLHVDGSTRGEAAAHHAHDPQAGMTGMVLGVSVAGPIADASEPKPLKRAARQLTLVMRSEPQRFGPAPAFGFTLAETNGGAAKRAEAHSPAAGVSVPGPTLVLTRGEAVAIALVNQLPEATAIHWHGIELDSYFDGVHGYSGEGQHVTPMIESGESFTVRFTPPRTGTFMYHTHLHDKRQLTSGMYGAIVVIEPGEQFATATDHVVVIGRGGPANDAPVVLNNERYLQMVWQGGTEHRIRLINITPDDILSVSLQGNNVPLTWRPTAKDGAAVAPDRSKPSPATQAIAVGETYDFLIDVPPGRQVLWLEVRSMAGRWQSQGRVIVK